MQSVIFLPSLSYISLLSINHSFILSLYHSFFPYLSLDIPTPFSVPCFSHPYLFSIYKAAISFPLSVQYLFLSWQCHISNFSFHPGLRIKCNLHLAAHNGQSVMHTMSYSLSKVKHKAYPYFCGANKCEILICSPTPPPHPNQKRKKMKYAVEEKWNKLQQTTFDRKHRFYEPFPGSSY